MKTVLPETDDAGLRRYLLGRMAETEAEALEHAYLADPQTLERLRAVEDDLLDDYAAGRLAEDERLAFEARYLTSAPLRNRVLAARALRRAMADSGQAVVHTLARRRAMRWTFPAALAAGLILGVVAYRLWPAAAVPTVSVSPSATAASLRPLPRDPVTAVLALSPVLLRGEQPSAARRVPAGTEVVVLVLEGDPASLPAPSSPLAAAVTTVEGAAVWSGAAQRAPGEPGSPRLASVRVPAPSLPPGDYLVTLSAPGSGTLYRYFLRISG
jgi:hypothetical protein